MEMLNRAVDGAALFKDMMQKVEAGAAPAAPVSPEVAAWNAEVDRKNAEKLARRMKAHDDALRAELAKVSQR
jgi:hypothetical protein